MSTSTLSARKPFEAILGAMKSETLLAPTAFEPHALASLFGEHRLHSAADRFKPNIQTFDLSFADGFILSLGVGPSFRTGQPSVTFHNDRAAGSSASRLDLTLDDLLHWLGQPDTQIDIRARQIANAGVPEDDDGGSAISPPALLLRGPTTHPLGNTDLKWRLETAHTSVGIGAEVGGDGSILHISGAQVWK